MPSRMKEFEALVDGFISSKRASGFSYGQSSVSVMNILKDTFGEIDVGDGPFVTQDLAICFMAQVSGKSSKTRQGRASHLRQFGLYLRRMGYSDCYVLPLELVPKATSEFVPYVFDHDEILAIAREFDSIRPTGRSPMAHMVFPAMFRTIYGCGLRAGETVRLRACDVDLHNEVLAIRKAKGDESRYAPMAGSLAEYLRRYIYEMGGNIPNSESVFFPNISHDSYGLYGVRVRFQKVYTKAGILKRDGTPPRVHDLRTTFAVHSLEQAERKGIPSSSLLPKLATYMGHKEIAATEYYLHLSEALGNVAATKFEEWCLKYEADAEDSLW